MALRKRRSKCQRCGLLNPTSLCVHCEREGAGLTNYPDVETLRDLANTMKIFLVTIVYGRKGLHLTARRTHG